MTVTRMVVLAVVAGALAGLLTSVHPSAAWAAALGALALTAVIERAPFRRALGLVVLAAASSAHAAHARERALAPPLARWLTAAVHADGQGGGDLDRADEGGRAAGPVIVRGTLARDGAPAEGGARLLIDVAEIRDNGGWQRVPGVIQAHVAGDYAGRALADWSAGRHVELPVILRRPQVWWNPGGPSPEWQALRRPFDLSGTVKSAALVTVTRGSWWNEAAAAVRGRVRRRVGDLFAPAQSQSAAIVAAVLIGDRAGLSDAVEHRLQIAGTYHVIAISGGNVALLTAMMVIGLRAGVRSFRVGTWISLAVVLAYGWVVGGEASVSRAVTVAAIYLLCGLVGLRPAGLDVLGASAVLLIILNPLVVIDAGAWLSFGATLGILVAFAGAATSSASKPAPSNRLRRAAQPLVVLFTATLAAELTVLPVSASVFTRVGVAGLVLNFVAIPMMAIVQIAGLVAVLAASLVPPLAHLAAVCADWAAALLVGSSRLVDLYPWLSWRVPPPSLAAVSLFYAAGMLWIGRRGVIGARRWRWALTALFAGAALNIAIAPLSGWAAPAGGRLRLTMIDVGQGDALLLQCPSGQTLLVDAGGASGGFDVGDRIVARALWARGVRRLDWLVFTHADLDHVGGALSIAAIFAPREVWEGVPVPRDPKRQALYDWASAHDVVWRVLQTGDRFEAGPVSVDVLHPPPPDWERQRVRNDDSVVLRVRYGDTDLLLTGDIEAATESQLLVRDTGSVIHVLKVAHHGSRTSSSLPFVQAFSPAMGLVSVGRGNLFGHPSPEVLARLTTSGAHIFRTDRDGAVTVETDGRELDVQTMAGRTWRMRVWRAP